MTIEVDLRPPQACAVTVGLCLSVVVLVLSVFRPLRYFLFFNQSKRVGSQGKKRYLDLTQAMAHSKPDGKLGMALSHGIPPSGSQGRRLQLSQTPLGEKSLAQRQQRGCTSGA